jgi:creatinine amidohydrolase/Fe(II)-dependent formamide hydrolase-like protein
MAPHELIHLQRKQMTHHSPRTRRRLAAIATLAMALTGLSAAAQLHRAGELNTVQIQALDRERTVVLLPGGILEEHGPYLPSYSDGYWNERLTEVLADAIVARPGWSVLAFPVIPLGNSGANDIGGRYNFPGTYAVRFATLRSIFMDLATDLGEQGFRRIFIVHGHGAPNHSRALEQAGDYFRDTYGGQMVHLGGLLPVMAAWAGEKTEDERREDGLPIHAGMDETSWMLYLRPDLVQPGYRDAEPLGHSEIENLIRTAQRPDWPGYLGSPRLATPEHGAQIWARASEVAVDLAMRILDGLDERDIPRFSDQALNNPGEARLDQAILEHEAKVLQRQQDWLKQRGLQ